MIRHIFLSLFYVAFIVFDASFANLAAAFGAFHVVFAIICALAFAAVGLQAVLPTLILVKLAAGFGCVAAGAVFGVHNLTRVLVSITQVYHKRVRICDNSPKNLRL